jgi:CheY-like chemotaxis protein
MRRCARAETASSVELSRKRDSCHKNVCGAHIAPHSLVSTATRDPTATRSGPDFGPGPDGRHVVLILSSDAVAAALLGALIETLGYLVHFYHPPETPDDAMRRAKPSIVMVDVDDPGVMNRETLGHARMRGSSVVIFGSGAAIARVQQLVVEQALESVVMPASIADLDAKLRNGVAD